MRAGPRRHLITIERPLVTQSPTGAETVTWDYVGRVWASVEPLAGREALMVADQITGVLDTRIRMAWSSALAGLTAKWRITFNGIIFDIKHVANVEFRNRDIELICQSGVNRG